MDEPIAAPDCFASVTQSPAIRKACTSHYRYLTALLVDICAQFAAAALLLRLLDRNWQCGRAALCPLWPVGFRRSEVRWECGLVSCVYLGIAACCQSSLVTGVLGPAFCPVVSCGLACRSEEEEKQLMAGVEEPVRRNLVSSFGLARLAHIPFIFFLKAACALVRGGLILYRHLLESLSDFSVSSSTRLRVCIPLSLLCDPC